MDKSEITVISVVGVAVLTVGIVIVLERGTGGPSESRELTTNHLTGTTPTGVELKDFVGINTKGVWQLSITQGDEWQVDLSYPEDSEDRPRVRVEGDRLVLAVQSDSRPFWQHWGRKHSEAFSARIVMPALEVLDVSGAGVVDFLGFSGDSLAISLSGAGKVDGADGHYNQLALTVSGAGDIDLRDVEFVDARTDLSGAGNVSLTMAGGVLSGRLSGASNLTYYGSVNETRISKFGIANIEHRR